MATIELNETELIDLIVSVSQRAERLHREADVRSCKPAGGEHASYFRVAGNRYDALVKRLAAAKVVLNAKPCLAPDEAYRAGPCHCANCTA